LAARFHTSSSEQPLYDILNAAFREARVAANLPVREAFQNAQKDIPLTIFQRIARLLILNRWRVID
jgi:hypothetical protein